MLKSIDNQAESQAQQIDTRPAQVLEIEGIAQKEIELIESLIAEETAFDYEKLRDKVDLWNRVAELVKSPLIKPKEPETGTSSHPEEMQEEKPEWNDPEDAD